MIKEIKTFKVLKKNEFSDNEFKINEKIKNKPKKAILHSNPEDARESQLNSLFNWKKIFQITWQKNNDSIDHYYCEIDDFFKENLNLYADNLQALLINPPWSKDKYNYFDFEMFVRFIIILFFSL